MTHAAQKAKTDLCRALLEKCLVRDNDQFMRTCIFKAFDAGYQAARQEVKQNETDRSLDDLT